jgi:hypothetical protein
MQCIGYLRMKAEITSSRSGIRRRSPPTPRDRSGRVKFFTLLSICEAGWVTVKDVLGKIELGTYLELFLNRLPKEKALSVALMRYSREGLLERRRVGRRYQYRVSPKGFARINYLHQRLGDEDIPPSMQDENISRSDQEQKKDDHTSESVEFLTGLLIKQHEAFKSVEAGYAALFIRVFKAFYSVLDATARAGMQLAQKNQEFEVLVCELVDCIEYWKRYVKKLRQNYSNALREIDYMKDELKKANRKKILKGERPIIIETDLLPPFIAFLSREDHSEIPKKVLEIVNEQKKSGQRLHR